jgi:hypothetical protein
MLVGNLTAWPPFPPVSNGHPERDQGTLQGCEFVSRTARHPAHLLVTIRYNHQDYTVVYWHTSESILLRLMASLRHCVQMPMSKTNEVELLELKPIGF